MLDPASIFDRSFAGGFERDAGPRRHVILACPRMAVPRALIRSLDFRALVLFGLGRE